MSKISVKIFCFIETHSSGLKVRKVARQLGFKNHFVVDSTGFSGGIWFCWKDDTLTVFYNGVI